ncbi:hypothetical protein OAO18_03720 [Francisellaceae bacterium]|nr:hypothetical protein [Francisellaceae bacterium]
MKIKNSNKIYTAVIASTFMLGVICFGAAIKHDYQNMNSDNSYQQTSNYTLFR